ncbi:PWWP domain-containing protein 6-like [Musa acuminata AAA Group]|uniref:PWWP domain-containing protein 6-like n=1 Tax=Musa acuminata AAA Group TaxID=214697 RepID=UPI0031D1E4B5
MASNPSEDYAGGVFYPSSSFSAAVAPPEPGKSRPETLTTTVEVAIDLEDGATSEAEKDAAYSMAIEVTVLGSENRGFVATVDAGAAHEKTRESAEIGLVDVKTVDEGHISTAEVGVEADAGGVGDQNVQVQRQEPSERRKRGRPRRSTVENVQHARYLQSFQDEQKDGFAVSDLVWGKVRSHPWWPGQIFDAADASDMALGAQKEGHFLVVYFGDKTFAWCDESHLKPFQMYFTRLEKQDSSDVFGTAVNEALGEVSRLLELGMACNCSGDEAYAVLKDRKVENAGVREGTCSSDVDKFWIVNSFEPGKIIDYVRMLGIFPCNGADSLDLVIAKAQLKAFRRSDRYLELSAFVLGQGIENAGESSASGERNCGNDFDLSIPVSSDSSSQKDQLSSRRATSAKKKHVSENGRKKKSLSELMDEKSFSHSTDGCRSGSGVRDCVHTLGSRQADASSHPGFSGKSKMKKLDTLGDLTTQSLYCDKPLKIRERIGRVERKRTQSPAMIKKSPSGLGHRRSAVPDETNLRLVNPRVKGDDLKDFTPYEMLSQLCLAAISPLKTYSFLNTTVSFFTEFSNWIVFSSDDNTLSEIFGGKQRRRKLSYFETATLDLATPDYIQDSYWSDIIVCSNFDEEHGSEGPKRKSESQVKRQKKRKKPKEQPELFIPSGSVPEAEQYLQIGSASTGIVHELETESPLDSLEEDVYGCISINQV